MKFFVEVELPGKDVMFELATALAEHRFKLETELENLVKHLETLEGRYSAEYVDNLYDVKSHLQTKVYLSDRAAVFVGRCLKMYIDNGGLAQRKGGK